MKLSDFPQVADAPIATSVEWEDKNIEFSVVQFGYGNVGDLWNAELPEGKKRNPWMLTQLVMAEDEEGKLAPISYERAAALPPQLGVLVHAKALELNGYGDLTAKN